MCDGYSSDYADFNLSSTIWVGHFHPTWRLTPARGHSIPITNRFREKPSLKLISDQYLININGWYDWWRPVVHQLIQLNMQPDAAALHAFISEPRIDKGAAFSFISDTCRWYKSTMVVRCSVHRRIVAGCILENVNIVSCTSSASIHSLHHEFGVSDW